MNEEGQLTAHTGSPARSCVVTVVAVLLLEDWQNAVATKPAAVAKWYNIMTGVFESSKWGR